LGERGDMVGWGVEELVGESVPEVELKAGRCIGAETPGAWMAHLYLGSENTMEPRLRIGG